MDIAALKRAKEKIDTKTGSDGFLSQKNIAEETIVRLLPPSPRLNGLFHLEVIKYWIAGKSYICASTFGKKSVMQEELDTAKQSGDEGLIELANNTDNKTGVSRKSEAWMALLQLEYKLNKNDEITGVTVVDDKGKVLQCGTQLLSGMIKVATSRKAITAAAGAEDGIADRESGSNIILSKVGQKLNTKYDAALDECMEMDAKYYSEIPDVFQIAQGQMKTASYQRAIMRQYLYGEDIPASVQAKEDQRAADAKAAYKAGSPAVAKKKKAVEEDDEEEEAPKPKKKAVAAPAPAAKKKAAKILLDEDDEDEDDAPPPVKKKKAAPVDEDDDEDEAPPKPVAKKKKAAPVDDEEDEDDAPPPKKKAVAPKKAAVTLDDDDDEDDAPPPVKKKKAAAIVEDDEDEDDAPPIKKKKAAPAPASKSKKSILDDIDELDDEDED